MPLDPQIKPLLAAMNALPAPDLATVSPAAWRAAGRMPLPEHPEPVSAVEEYCIAGPAGELPVRLYRPGAAAPYPVVYFHGGGFVLCDLDTHDAFCRRLCNRLQAMVVSVGYRLAPEHPFPAAPEDCCYAATAWVAAQAATLGVDASRLMVAGDSAGGCLAAVVCQMARDRAGPAIARQLLLYPVTDSRFDTVSYHDNAEGYFLTRTMMQWFWRQYLACPDDARNPYAAPLQAQDFSGLPPAVVLVAEYDPLRDEGEAYAHALQRAGVPVLLRRYAGTIHGFLAFLDIAVSRQALDDIHAALSV